MITQTVTTERGREFMDVVLFIEGRIKVSSNSIGGYNITQYSSDQREKDAVLYFKDRVDLNRFIDLLQTIQRIEDDLKKGKINAG